MTAPDHVGPLSETNTAAPEISLSRDEALNLADSIGMIPGTAPAKIELFLRQLAKLAERDPKGRAFGTVRVTIPLGRERSRF